MLKVALENLKVGNNCHYHEEYQYINLIKHILSYGEMVNGRNGKALTIFGSAMHFSLDNNKIPILTTKKVAWKTCAKELFWFLSGNTDNKILKSQNVHIWDDNASRDFLDSRNLNHYKEDDLGPIYGHQWRFFNAPYLDCETVYDGLGIDQLKYIIENLKDPINRYSRRLIMSAWNPQQLHEMALPPCHILSQFNVINNKLSCSVYQRSGDVGLGIPFNIASYSFLTHIIAKHTGLEANELVYYLGNAHIYDDHLEALKEQMEREPFQFPNIEIMDKYDDIGKYGLKDINIENYKFHEKINMKMRK